MVTELGKLMASLPNDIELTQFIYNANFVGFADAAMVIASALSKPNFFLNEACTACFRKMMMIGV
jgi:HrpA-like RNA helicase